jgi:hypothetical protein
MLDNLEQNDSSAYGGHEEEKKYLWKKLKNKIGNIHVIGNIFLEDPYETENDARKFVRLIFVGVYRLS